MESLKVKNKSNGHHQQHAGKNGGLEFKHDEQGGMMIK